MADDSWTNISEKLKSLENINKIKIKKINDIKKYLSSSWVYVLFILRIPNITKIFNEEKINKIDTIIWSKPPRIKFDDWNPPVEIIVKDKLNLSNILKSVKFKKKIEIKNIIT